jgi:phospholipase C
MFKTLQYHIAILFFIAVLSSTGIQAKPTGTLKDMEHVVLFMQENRPFDHYFGVLKGVRGFNDRAAPNLPSGRTPF